MVSRPSAEKRSASAYLASTQAIQGSSGILSSLIEICDPSSLQGRTPPRGPEFDVQGIAFEKEGGRNVQQFCELQEARGADAAFANLAFSIFNRRQSERLRKGYFTDPKNFSSALNLHANVFINGTQWCYLFGHNLSPTAGISPAETSSRISARNDAAPVGCTKTNTMQPIRAEVNHSLLLSGRAESWTTSENRRLKLPAIHQAGTLT